MLVLHETVSSHELPMLLCVVDTVLGYDLDNGVPARGEAKPRSVYTFTICKSRTNVCFRDKACVVSLEGCKSAAHAGLEITGTWRTDHTAGAAGL